MRKKKISRKLFDTFKPEIQKLLEKGKVMEFLWLQYHVGATQASVTFDGPDFIVEYKGPRMIEGQVEGRYDLPKNI